MNLQKAIPFICHTRSKVIVLMLSLCTGIQLEAQTSGFQYYSSQLHKEVKISTIADWEQHKWIILNGLQEAMGPLPRFDNLPDLDILIKDTLETSTYHRLHIEFTPVENEIVYAYLYLPKRVASSGKNPAILALHPTGMQGKDIVDGQGKEHRGYARELAERGYVVIAPDYPSFGELADYDFDNDRYESASMAAIFYHMRCIDLLCKRPDVDPERIGVIGHSLGGHNAMFVGAFDPRIKVVVTSSGWTQLASYDIGPSGIERYGGRLGPWAQDRYMPNIRDKFDLDDKKIPFDLDEIISVIAPRVFFTNSPINDSNFDVNGVKVGIAKAAPVFDFLDASDHLIARYPEAEHDFPTPTRQESYEVIDRTLNHIPSPHKLE